MNRRGRKPLIAIKMQIDLFKKYHEQLQKTNLKYNNHIFTIMSKEIDGKMSPKALHMSFIRNYANSAFSKPSTSRAQTNNKSRHTSFASSPSTNKLIPIADKRWQDWKSVVNGKCQKTKTLNQAVRTNMLNDAVARTCGPTQLSELKERLLKCLDIDIVELKNNNTDINEADLTNNKRVSIAQQRIMFTYMKANEDIGKSQLKGPNEEIKRNILLKQLTELLNKMGPATRSPDKWLKYWQDWKLHIKTKWNKINHFKHTEDTMQDYGHVPCQLTPLEEQLVEFCSLDTMENGHELQTCQNKINMARNHGKQLQMDDVVESVMPHLPEQFQINVSVPGPSVPGPSVPGPSVPGPSVPGPSVPGPSVPGPSVPGPSESPETGIIEDVIQAGSIIKMELDSSDSDDPLNFEAEQISSEPHSPELKPEPEIEEPATPATNPPRRKRVRRIIQRPLTRSRLDTINRMTVNELRKALTQKNEIKKQFYAEYMVEVRKQTEALVAIAKKLTDR